MRNGLSCRHTMKGLNGPNYGKRDVAVQVATRCGSMEITLQADSNIQAEFRSRSLRQLLRC